MKEYRLKIERDDSNDLSPREWDNLGTMACFHRRYNLGDNHDLSIEEVKAINDSDKYISLPLFLYDHSGITMNTVGFHCPWDSGQVGIIFISKEDIRREYNVKRISKKLKARVSKYLEGEVSTYDQYLTGDVWYYSIEEKTVYTSEEGDTLDQWDVIDSCGGFFGEEYAKEEGGHSLKSHQNS